MVSVYLDHNKILSADGVVEAGMPDCPPDPVAETVAQVTDGGVSVAVGVFQNLRAIAAFIEGL